MRKPMILIPLCALSLSLAAYADDKASDKDQGRSNEDKASMHEKMAKAHQDAADCLKKLKSGESEKQCHDKFMSEAKASGMMEWHGHHHGDYSKDKKSG